MNKTIIKNRECQDSECTETFRQFNSLQKYCSPQCKIKNIKVEFVTGFPLYKKLLKKSKSNKRKRIPFMSKKRKLEFPIYSVNRKIYLNRPENRWCPVFPSKRAIEVHHKKGRIGSLYLDERYWLAVSDQGHKKIELNPKWAKEKGYSLSRLAK